jgi:curved DNA-binding protein CbpA
MASAPAGKFQDHYKIFGVDPKASTDEIHGVYLKHIELYHPKRGKEPDQEKYDAAQLAWEVLGSPEARKVFDSVRSGGDDEAEVSFTGWSFFEEMRNDVNYRNAILIALYDHKRQKPRTPAVTRRQLDMLIRMSEEAVQLSLWYLKDRQMVVVDDRSKIQITAAGMD